MKSVLFLIPTLGGGGAEKVLVNLANNLDKEKYDVTVQTLFKGGVHTEKLKEHVKYITGKTKPFRGNVQLFKLFSPSFLYRRIVKKRYDIVVAYLEGVVCRIITGCPYKDSKKLAWIHSAQKTEKTAKYSFRSTQEMQTLYNRFDKIVCVAETVKEDFKKLVRPQKECAVLYNVNETDEIKRLAEEGESAKYSGAPTLISVGRLIPVKGFDRLIRLHKRLLDEGVENRLQFLGDGRLRGELEQQIENLSVKDSVSLLGFQSNPYPYVKNADLFVCSSISEGFSTAVTEALVVGTPVVSTDVSGAHELLGKNNEYGIVVGQDEEALFAAVKRLLTEDGLLAQYKAQAEKRGQEFSKEKTVQAVEELFENL